MLFRGFMSSGGLERGRPQPEQRVTRPCLRGFRVVRDLDTIVWSLTGGLTAATRRYIDPDGSRIVDSADAARAFSTGNMDRTKSFFVFRTEFKPEQEELFKKLCRMILQANVKQSKTKDTYGFGLEEDADVRVISKLLSGISGDRISRMRMSHVRGGLVLSLVSGVDGDDLPGPVPWAVREALEMQELPEMRMHYPRYREIAQQYGVGVQILTMAADQHSVDAIFSFYRRDPKNNDFLSSLSGTHQFPSVNRPGDRERLQIIVDAMSYVGLAGTYCRVNPKAYELALHALATSRWVTFEDLQQPSYAFVTMQDPVVPVVILRKASGDDLGFEYNPIEHGGMFITGQITDTFWKIQSYVPGRSSEIASQSAASVIFK